MRRLFTLMVALVAAGALVAIVVGAASGPGGKPSPVARVGSARHALIKEAATGELKRPSIQIKVTQDCSYRRQAEENITYSVTDPSNLVAGQNDSRLGFNQCGIDFSTNNGAAWGDMLPPFRQHLNDPQDAAPNTINGDPGTFHTYDAASDPVNATDPGGGQQPARLS